MSLGSLYPPRKQKTFTEAVLALIGHLVGTGILFVAFLLIGWGISVVLHWLHGIHPFPTAIFDFVTKIELWLVYADAILCGIVVIAGAGKFVKDLSGD